MKWEAINLFENINSGYLSLNKIIGFNESDYWIVGGRGNYGTDFGLTINYNGTWNDYGNVCESILMDTDGNSSNDIWFCGIDGIVIHKYHDYWRSNKIEID